MKAVLIAIIALLAICGSARAQNSPPAEERYAPFKAVPPPCDEAWVLERITSRFAQTRSEFWHSNLQIEGYDRVREIGLRSNGLSYIPRRFCIARAFLSDHKPRGVIYQIQDDLGIIGWGFGVGWCVIGLDPSLAYAPHCQALRPIVDTDIVGEKGLQALIDGLLRNDRSQGVGSETLHEGL